MNIEHEFWVNFWPSFTSSIISGLIFTVIIGYLISTFRKPKLKVCLDISTSLNANLLTFHVINSGKSGLKPSEMKWNIYFPFILEPDSEIFKESCLLTKFKEQPYYNVTGFNQNTILPGDSLELIRIPVTKRKNIPTLEDFEWIDEAKYYYSLTTIKGQVKYINYFKYIFSKRDFIEDSSFIKRPVFEIIDKVL